jgi:hypothetical protein
MENSSNNVIMRWQQFLTITEPYNFDETPSLTISKANNTIAGKAQKGTVKSEKEIMEHEINGCSEILKDISKGLLFIFQFRGRLDAPTQSSIKTLINHDLFGKAAYRIYCNAFKYSL